MTDEELNQLEIQFPDAALVKRYLEIRTFLEAEAAAQAEHIKPHVNNMEAITNELHRRLLKRNPDWQPGMKANGATPDGTFFLKTNSSIKVADRRMFFEFLVEPGVRLLGEGNDDALVGSLMPSVLDEILLRIQAFVTAHVAKEAVEGYMDQHHALPPGVTLDRITKLEVRKT